MMRKSLIIFANEIIIMYGGGDYGILTNPGILRKMEY